MVKIRRLSALAKLFSAVAAVGLVTALCACSPTDQKSADAANGSDPSAYPVGSLRAVHADGQLDGIEEYSKKVCLSCHDREAIVTATENWGGVEGVNPHAAHTESYDCVKCHSVDGESVLVCNDACHRHDWELPEGWRSPTAELPSADGSSI